MTDRPDGAPHPAAPSRPNSPFRLDLEQQRRRARELQRALQAGDAAAQARFRRHHPKAHALPDAAIGESLSALAEAQLVIARELGVPSWPRLKAHILAMREARAAIAVGAETLDADAATLHIRCGSDIASALREAGFGGDFLEYSDAFCQGPVVGAPDWLARRAAFLAEAYGGPLRQSAAEILARLEQAERGLLEAAETHERVVLWFEHDSYDQLVLARCLAALAERKPRRLELVAVNHYPGAARFIGLGQLPSEALRLLWRTRREVTTPESQRGLSVWAMLRAADPRPLAVAAASGTPEWPDLAPALRRHCQELPWTQTGLGLTERLVLEILAEGPRRVSDIFSALVREREPLPFLGDVMLLWILQCMRRVAEPLITGRFENGESRWAFERLSITPLGRAVLAGEVDFLSLRPPSRWLGGACIDGSTPGWRWDEAARSVVRR